MECGALLFLHSTPLNAYVPYMAYFPCKGVWSVAFTPFIPLSSPACQSPPLSDPPLWSTVFFCYGIVFFFGVLSFFYGASCFFDRLVPFITVAYGTTFKINSLSPHPYIGHRHREVMSPAMSPKYVCVNPDTLYT